MVRGNATAYLGSPRHGRDGHRREDDARGDGGCRDALHRLRAVGDVLVEADEEAIDLRAWLSFLPSAGSRNRPPRAAPADRRARSIKDIVPVRSAQEVRHVRVDRLGSSTRAPSSRSSSLFAAEIIVGFARLGGRGVGIVANQPKVKGGVLMVDSSDKAARFIWLCNAYNIPLVFLVDIAGFMVGSKVERARHHPPRRQDGVRHLAGHRAEDLRRGPQVLRRRALRDVRARLRAGRGPVACRRDRSRSWGPSRP